MTRIPSLVGFGLVLCCAAPPAAAQPEAGLAWVPEAPRQGRLFVVVVRPEGGRIAVGAEGTAADEPLHFERAPDGTLRSPAAVPVDAEGSVTLAVTLRFEDGAVRSLRAEVPVTPGDFRHEELTVAPRFGSPLSPADRARLDRDRERAARVSRAAHRTPRIRGDRVVLPRDDRVTSEFGNGRIFNGQVSSRHMGLDLDGNPGDTVRAAARAVVALVDDFLLAGRIVYLNHGGGLLSGYFHLSRPLVAEGDTVDAGAPIGLVGATGRVTGPHLHWVVRYGGASVDPRSLLDLEADRGR